VFFSEHSVHSPLPFTTTHPYNKILTLPSHGDSDIAARVKGITPEILSCQKTVRKTSCRKIFVQNGKIQGWKISI